MKRILSLSAALALAGAMLMALPNAVDAKKGKWKFVATKTDGKNVIFGPYDTFVDCLQVRNIEALTDNRYLHVGECVNYGLK